MTERDKQIINKIKSMIPPDLNNKIKRLIVYGSRVKGEETDYSDLDIEQVQSSFGFSYLVNPKMSVYGRYMYHEYNDREDSSLEGQYSMVSVGLKYSF